MIRPAALSLLLTLPLFGTFPDAARTAVDQITGLKGVYVESEDVYKVSFPRTDVKVTVDRSPMQAFMGLTSWAAFTTGTLKEAMVTGELLLFEDEVNPVMSAALDGGLEVTALHNHYLFDSPRVMFLHVAGAGKGADLARGLRRCLDKVKEIRTASPVPAAQFAGADIPQGSRISAQPVDKILRLKGHSYNGMYKANIERHAKLYGREVGGQMGANTWAAFAGADDNALVDGEFAVTTAELQAVLKTLRGAGIQIVAIHNNMTHEEPQFVFLHYWGRGRATNLAKSVRGAMDKQAISPGAHIGHQAH
jgi:hypothetical protein